MTAIKMQNELIVKILAIEDLNLLQSVKENFDESKLYLKLSNF